MNRQIARLAAGLLACFTVVFVQLNLMQVVRADQYNTDPSNTRPVVRDFSKPRGQILTADGVVVAESVPSNDRFELQRVYPTGELFAQAVGYFSFSFGSDGVELVQNDVLSGRTAEQQLGALTDIFSDRDTSGDVVLTLRADLQRVARDALGEREGSVVLLEPATGAVRALWSWPSYDPNVLAAHDFEAVEQIRQILLADPRDPLLGNAYRQNYLTGSAFKVVTASSGLETGTYTADSFFPPTDSYTPPQTDNPIQNYGGSTCGGDFTTVFYRSCNTAFAEMSVTVGAEGMVSTAHDFGFDRAVPIDLPRPAGGTFGQVEDFEDNVPLLAIGGFGQGETKGTPLNMALVAAGIANRGVIQQPYVVDRTLDRDGRVLERTAPRTWTVATDTGTASLVGGMMVEVVNQGTARCCMQLANGVQAAAKTGTAQLNATGEPPSSHAWIISYAPAEAPRYAVAVFVKATPEVTAGTGGTVAGPVARQVLDAALAAPDVVPPGG